VSLKAVTKAGDAVAIESPTYFGIFQVMESLGLESGRDPYGPGGPDVNVHFAGEKLSKTSTSKPAYSFPTLIIRWGAACRMKKRKQLVQLITQLRDSADRR
jgi:DNA-binding transcriptional MocR family regulator